MDEGRMQICQDLIVGIRSRVTLASQATLVTPSIDPALDGRELYILNVTAARNSVSKVLLFSYSCMDLSIDVSEQGMGMNKHWFVFYILRISVRNQSHQIRTSNFGK
jgi:hypothetical protein